MIIHFVVLRFPGAPCLMRMLLKKLAPLSGSVLPDTNAFEKVSCFCKQTYHDIFLLLYYIHLLLLR